MRGDEVGVGGGGHVRCCAALEFGLAQFHLHAVNAIDAVHKQDQDEDEGDLSHV